MTFPNPAQRGWWGNYEREASILLPADPDEAAEYIEQLAHEAEHGPGDDPTNPQGVAP